MASAPDVRRYVAFSADPDGGNPAGVVLDASALDADAMLGVAADVGYSESAFVVERPGAPRTYDVRYFSPVAEVPFCGHATIAAAAALAERDGPGTVAFHTASGLVEVRTGVDGDGHAWAALESVAPALSDVPEGALQRALAALGWSASELDPALPPRIAYAGARHLVLAAATRERLAALDYDFDALRAVSDELELITVALVWRESTLRFRARNPFPAGGVVEDPATGAAAAAFGGYLRLLGLLEPPATVEILQGEELGRPSRLVVDVPAGDGGIRVTGNAVRI